MAGVTPVWFLKALIALWSYKILGMGNTQSTFARERLCGWADDELDDGYPDITDLEDPSTLRTSLTDSDMFFRTALDDTMVPYVENGYPGNVYLDQDTATQAANLLTVISEYAEQESAKFVTGARSLSELDAYFDEIERLGATEYVQIYQDYSPKDENLHETESRTNVLGGDIWYN